MRGTGREAIAYLSELRENWRPIAAATFAMATGYGALSMFVNSVFAPQLIGEFGWSKAQFAMISTISLVAGLCIPLAGRAADVWGVRRTALVGIVAMPLTYMATSMMSGAMWVYVVIYIAQNMFCIATTSSVYSRIAVQHSNAARGLALAVVATGPGIMGMLGGPVLNGLVEAWGWRAGYQALAVFCVVAGAMTLWVLPAEKAAGTAAAPRRKASEDYPQIFRTPAFWLLVAAMILCNLPQVVFLSQLKLILLDNGISAGGVSLMISAFAAGGLAGRFLAGIALDRFPPHIVAFVLMGLPGVGLLLIASSLDSTAVLSFAVLCCGFAFGAEGDIVGYLVSRKFAVAIFSSVMGLMTLAMSIAASSGALLLSLTLAATGGFDFFLLLSAGTVFVGCLMFLPLREARQVA